jgi:lysophospholipase L1-like esterase
MPQGRQKLLLKRGQMIVFEGDSITSRREPPSLDTWPFLRLMAWERTWADDFSEMLFCLRPDLKLKFRHGAVGGSAIPDVLARFDKFVAPHKPDWVIMTIGANDATRKISLKDFAAGMVELIKRVRKLSGGRVVFLGGKNKGKCIPYYRVLKRIAKSEGAMYVDIGKPLAAKAKQLKELHALHTIYSDGNHLNRIGSLIVAATALSALGFELGS